MKKSLSNEIRTKLIVVTGPESSGKTALVDYLGANHLYPVVAEYAREFLEQRDGKYVRADLDILASQHLSRVEQAVLSEDKQVVSDTFLLNIRIWSRYRFGSVSPLIEDLYHRCVPRLYLLASPDIAWEEDPLRDPTLDRHEIFESFKATIESSGVPFLIVSGTGEQRFRQAAEGLSRMFENTLPSP